MYVGIDEARKKDVRRMICIRCAVWEVGRNKDRVMSRDNLASVDGDDYSGRTKSAGHNGSG